MRVGGVHALCLWVFLACAATSAAGLPSLQWDNLDVMDPEIRFSVEIGQEQMLARFERTPGLKVLWWNIEGGNTNRHISSGGCPRYRFDSPLEHNLVSLSRSTISPDIIAMSEFAPNTLAPWATRELETIYPHHTFLPYSAGAPSGIGVFSKSPLTMRETENLSWEAGANETEKLANRKAWNESYSNSAGFDRPYARFEGSWQGKPFTLIPQHLANPWPGLRNAKAETLPRWLKGAPLVGSLLTRICAAALTGEEIFFEHDSPLSVQARELQWRLERDFGQGVDSAAVLLIGDFNAPTRSSVHRLLTSKLKDSFGAVTRNIPSAQASIPTNCAAQTQSVPPLKIDHALTSRGMKTPLSKVLRLHGSDHYPLLTVVEPR